MQKPVVGFGESAVIRPASVLPLAGQGIRLTRDGRTILDAVDLTLRPEPAITVLIGPNGAGKSLLARVLAGLVAPDQGTISWAGSRPDRMRMPRIGFVFQKPVVLNRSVRANIEFALAVCGVGLSERHARALAVLDKAGLAGHAETDARVLSGGEAQRLALARTIAMEPELFILDEPAVNLDPNSTANIEHQLLELRSSGRPVLLITHDLGQARRIASRVVFMHKGRILEDSSAAEFFRAPKTDEAARYIRGELLV
jgi:tungstate transport system ATP-binding protein